MAHMCTTGPSVFPEAERPLKPASPPRIRGAGGPKLMGQLPQGAEPRDEAAQQRHVDLQGQGLNVQGPSSGPSSGWFPVSSLSLWGVSARVVKSRILRGVGAPGCLQSTLFFFPLEECFFIRIPEKVTVSKWLTQNHVRKYKKTEFRPFLTCIYPFPVYLQAHTHFLPSVACFGKDPWKEWVLQYTLSASSSLTTKRG